MQTNSDDTNGAGGTDEVRRADEVSGTDDARGAGGTDGGVDDSLDEAASSEREYLRRRLRAELGREPTEAELNQWLRQHTEGH